METYPCGHPRTPENTYTKQARSSPKPQYTCKACEKARNSAHKKAKAEIARELRRIA